MTANAFGTLRPCVDGDSSRVLEWRNHPGVRGMMYNQHEISVDEHRAWWARMQAREDTRLLIYTHADEPSGVVSITDINPAHGTSFWAFYARPGAPRGTGSRMEFLALDHVFLEMKLRKLSCEVLARNEKVIRLHERFGFRTEGVFHDHLYIGGMLETVHRLAMFNSKWREGRSAHASRLKERL